MVTVPPPPRTRGYREAAGMVAWPPGAMTRLVGRGTRGNRGGYLMLN